MISTLIELHLCATNAVTRLQERFSKMCDKEDLVRLTLNGHDPMKQHQWRSHGSGMSHHAIVAVYTSFSAQYIG